MQRSNFFAGVPCESTLRRRQPVNAVRSEYAAEQAPAIVAKLSSVLPPESLLWRAEQTIPFECDGLAAFRQKPLAVALPQTEAQVRDILRACHATKTPVV